MSKKNKEIINNEFKPDFSKLISQFPELKKYPNYEFIKHQIIN